jgi:outer membrane protein assembly factor BamB
MRTGAAVLAAALTVSIGATHERAIAQSGQTLRAASDWPQWRGPKRDGSVATALPVEWPSTLTKRWEVVVGSGHASPVVAGNRVVVIARQGEQEIVRALDLASGRELWKAEYAAPYRVNPAAQSHGPGSKSTPAIASERVFTFGIGGVLSAFDLATGKRLWNNPAPAVLPLYGTAMSPLVDGSSVIAHVGGHENGIVTAFDAATGKPRWQWKGDGPGYGSPVIGTFAGVRQVITQTQKFIVGLDATDGSLLWQIPFTTEFHQSAVTPVIYRDLVIYSGLDKPLAAARPTREGAKWTATPVWSNPQTPMFMSSPVVLGTTLYGLTHRNRGQLVAIDPVTGKTLWNTQGREGENASLFGDQAWLLVSTTNGELIVARQSPQKFEEVRRYRIADSAMWAHPAVAGRSFLVKDTDKVICWGY